MMVLIEPEKVERALADIGLRLDVSDWDALSPNEQAFAVLDLLGDGTDLYEYYYWQVGVGAANLPAAAQRIGASECGDLLRRANDLFPADRIQPAPAGGATSVYLDEHEVDFEPIERAFAELNETGRGIRSTLARFARHHLDEFPEFADSV